MLAVYKGKEYFYGFSFWDKKIELRSITQPDDTFKFDSGRNMYVKDVYKSECEDIRDNWVYAVYNKELIEVCRINSNTNQFLVFASSTHIYSDEFIEKVLGGQEGRDIFAWCDIDKFTGFNMCTEKYPTHEDKTEIPLTMEQAKECVHLLRPER